MSDRKGTGRYTGIKQINGDVDYPTIRDTDWDPQRHNKQLPQLQKTLQTQGISTSSDTEVIAYIQGHSAELLGASRTGSFGYGESSFTLITWEYADDGPSWEGFENYEPEPRFFMGLSQQVCPQTNTPFAFVVCEDGSIRIGQKHKQICAGAPAIWAGEVFFCGNGRVFSWGDRSGTYNAKPELKAEVTKYLLPFPSNLFQKYSPSSTKLRGPAAKPKITAPESDSSDIDLNDL